MTTTETGERRLTARQAQLLDQLEELFLAEGFAGFTLEDLAVRLHCSKTTLYALADSKEQLAVRVVRHFFRRATGAVEARTATEDDPARRVTVYLEAVARALTPASRAFHRDLEAFPPDGDLVTAGAHELLGPCPGCDDHLVGEPHAQAPGFALFWASAG